eukprot:705856-Pelagomonas_calceolata.AAC.1
MEEGHVHLCIDLLTSSGMEEGVHNARLAWLCGGSAAYCSCPSVSLFLLKRSCCHQVSRLSAGGGIHACLQGWVLGYSKPTLINVSWNCWYGPGM